MTDGTFHLFVYGTLKSTESRSDLLASCRLVGAATVGGVLYDIDGEYPALVYYGNSPVPGEIWECPAEVLKTLDSYEDTSSGLFRRIGLNARAGSDTIGCWAYVAGPRLAHKLTPARRIDAWPTSNHGS
jgi:gamma-glutamylcyclotransferase (GGCT)/AIG2-like uncharacterized protein YtfP